MIAHNPKSLCREAELYYYDFLCDESRRLIPEPIVNHIEQCQCCLGQISQLEAVLSQADGPESERVQVGSAVTTMLKLHFAYIGKPVTCNIVKPFLPTLLDQALGIHIPTPIVTHVCDCQQCSEDLDIIRCLNLSREQLCRLSQLFAEEPPKDSVGCSEMAEMAKLVAAMDFGRTTAEALQHLCKCPICRGTLYEERQKMCDSLSEYERSPEFPCESVSATDIFDYVVPYGLDPASDQYAKFRQSLTSHLRTCPTCLAKMQQLHDTVYGIVERHESEVITVYHIDESAKAKAASETEELYAGFPIRVDVKQREEEVKAEQPVPAIDFAATLKQKISAKKLKPLFKTAVAAAAVILIAVVLFRNIPTARAVTLERIYEVIEKVKNVHIASFVPGKTRPTQERWVSRTANTYLLKTEKESVLWDIGKGVRKSKQVDTAVTETVPLTAVSAADAEKKITGSLGLMPFYNMPEIPKDADWSRVAGKDLEAAAKGIEVYDLTWTERAYDGSTVFNKWRVFADPKTNLPERTEFYQKSPADDEYIFISAMEVEYLSDSKMQEVIKEASF
jgi:hypothetical protein